MSATDLDTLPPPASAEPPPMTALPMSADLSAGWSTPRPRRRWTVTVLVLLLLAAGVLVGWKLITPGEVATTRQTFTVARRSFPVVLQEKGELKAANSIQIRSEIEGRATIISLVDEGSHVKKGDLLVELASEETDEKIRDAEIREATASAAYEAAVKELEILRDENASKIRKAELQLRLADLALEKYKEGEAVEQRQDALLAHDKAKSVLERAKDNLQDSEELFKQGFLTRIELENDRFSAYEAELELKKAALAQQVLERFTIPMDMQEKESDVVEARKELDREQKAGAASEAKSEADVAAKKSELELTREKLTKLRDQKAKSRITAPADGLVVYANERGWWRNDNEIQEGATVYERQNLIELPDTSKMKVVLRVHEAQTERLKLDLPALVEVEGFTGRKFTGKVSKIAVLADSQNRWLNPNLKEYETEVLLDGDFTELKPGVTARVEITAAQLDNVLAIPVQCVLPHGPDSYAIVMRPSGPEPIKVGRGLNSNEFVEIKEGLQEGDEVLLAPKREMLPDRGRFEDEENGHTASQPVEL